MATSGTTTFNLDLNEIAEEAFERCGSELRTGYDLRTARRSLNLLLSEWASKGINLWAIEEGSQVLTADDGIYTLPTDTVDLLEHVIRTGSGDSQVDVSVVRISASTYAMLSDKTATGRPNQIWIDRQRDAPVVYLWPIPDTDNYTLVYWRLRRFEDVGSVGTTTQDIPFRFLPALVAGLAYQLSLKIPGAFERMPALKQIYDEQWQIAADEDREKTPLRIAPDFR